jgi:hypothetical protein
MVSTNLQNTFLSVYKDDFRDSDNYHRILFNSGRALQARELTQSQTIIQKEIERFARYIFKEGALLTSSLGNLATRDLAVDFVKLDTTVNQLPTGYATLVGTTVTNTGAIASPISARIKAVIPAEGGDPATLMVEYIDGGGNDPINITTPEIFRAGQNLTTTLGTLTVQTIDTTLNPATGKGSILTTPTTEFFALGHFVFVPSQTIVVSKYDRFPTITVGFIVSEQIVTVSDELALYDNQGSTPNLTSPGADRYRIRMTLSLEDDVEASDTFIPLIKMTRGDVELMQTGDNALNRIGDTIARRTFEESGNYIVNNKQKFQLQILEDKDPLYSTFIIQPGIAYLNGRRIEKTLSTTLRTSKPRDPTYNTGSVAEINLSADYGSYFLADSMYGLISKTTTISNNAKASSILNLYDSANRLGTVIGTARIRSLSKVENNYKIHIFDLNMDSNGAGSLYSISNTRSIGADAANYANLVLDENRVKLYNTANNSLLFALPQSRPYSLETLTMNVGEVFTSTTNGSGIVSFTTSRVADKFINEADWLIAYDSGGQVLTTSNVTKTSGGAGSTSVQFSGLLNNKAVRLYSYVNITGNVKAKTLVENAEETVSVVNGKFKLVHNDIVNFTAIVDNTTNEDITSKFYYDFGQKDNFYDVGRGILRPGLTPPAGTIKVVYDYYAHGAGDFYSVNSYSGNYEDIPEYEQKNSTIVNLGEVIDLRPDIDSSGTSFTGVGADILRIPANGGTISVNNADFYTSRVDVIYLDADDQIRLKRGTPSIQATYPIVPTGALALHYITFNPYTMNKNDVEIITPQNAGYTMSDIRRLETRISKLEEITTLTLAETNTNNITVVDENGNIRTKLGLTADGFQDHSQSISINNPNYRASLDRLEGSLRPRQIRRQVPLYYDSGASSGVKRYNNTIWPVFTEEVLISQTVASGPMSINQFTLSKFIGSATLYPDVDAWTERRTVTNGQIAVVVKDGDLSTYDKFKEFGLD